MTESLEKTFTVKPEHAASRISSGAVDVLSTPMMIAYMEDVSFNLAKKFIKEGETTVGIHVDVRHLHPAPINSEVKVRSTLVKVEGKRLVFKVEAYWKDVLIGEGIHERYVVNEEEFMRKLAEKMKA
ncbi:MAG: thioesterase family protein [Candidatus Aramenus sulfurataquae]|jgi:predicted thioesterase|uniref:Thioesterase n=3 Tax=Candidatus Aramenus sulfurataquae TaxID=1326980 RepID=A0A0F2LMR6_9CREN|nr:thioesterase family protein [Candidatus Aramenus sulfurataquae]